MAALSITVLTQVPSPYQVELFNSVDEGKQWELSVIYEKRYSKARSWDTPEIKHKHCFLENGCLAQVESWVRGHNLVVFSGYRQTQTRRLIEVRHATGEPWAFWGERPGYRFPGRIGRQYRAWALRHLWSSGAPIWGIGEWAIEGYRAELGADRCFVNMPYFSNLDPFFDIERHFHPGTGCRFLFSGQFIERKGIDLLVSAFQRLTAQGVEAELHLLGGGPAEKRLRHRLSALTDKVRFYGFKPWHELACFYKVGDVLCAPSLYDGWGLIVPEGLAAGMPVISTDKTGAARELIEPQGNGWIVPAGEENALYLAMKSAATLDCEGRRQMCKKARQTATGQNLTAGVRRFGEAVEISLEVWRGFGKARACRGRF